MTNTEAIEVLKNPGKAKCQTLDKAIHLAIVALELVPELKKANECIRRLLTEEYGSICQFCVYDNDIDAECAKIGGSGRWCCENARWNGEVE